jgi:hypothetical protein
MTMNFESKKVNSISLALATIVQTLGYVTGIVQAFADPFNTLLLCGVGLLIMTPIAFHYVLSRKITTPTLVRFGREAVPQQEWQYPWVTRFSVAMIWAIFATTSLSVMTYKGKHLFESPELATTTADYPARYMYNSLIEPNINVVWGEFAPEMGVVEASKFFNTNGNERVFGAILDDSRTGWDTGKNGWTKWSLSAGVFTLAVVLSAKKEFGTVNIDDVRVFVDAYRPTPGVNDKDRDFGIPVGGFGGDFFYTRVSPPPNGKRIYFSARYLPKRGSEESGRVYLEPGKPEFLRLKIDAATSGYYMLGVEILLSSGIQLQRYVVPNFQHVIYYRERDFLARDRGQ